MTAELYTKVVDDEGNESYVQVEEVSIDDDTFYADTRYQKVADRDTKRRLKYKGLVDQLTPFGIEVDEEGNIVTKPQAQDDKTPETPVDTPKVPTMEEIYNFVKTQQQTESQAEQEARRQREEAVNKAMETHKLTGDDMRAILENSSDPEAVAAILGRKALHFGETNGGQSDEEARKSEIENMGARLKKRMGAPN